MITDPAERLQILLDATAHPQDVMTDDEIADIRAVLDELKQLRDERERAVPYGDSKAAWDARQVGSFRACADCYSPMTCAEADEPRCP